MKYFRNITTDLTENCANTWNDSNFMKGRKGLYKHGNEILFP
jgi:hypothetical protein